MQITTDNPFKIAASTYTPLDVFKPGVAYYRHGYANGTSVFAKSTGRQWAPTINGEIVRDGNAAPLSFETAAEALAVAIDMIETDTQEVEVFVKGKESSEDRWVRGMRGPVLGYCPTMEQTMTLVWTCTSYKPWRVSCSQRSYRTLSAA